MAGSALGRHDPGPPPPTIPFVLDRKESVDGAERGFFQLFWPPPYWTGAPGDEVDTDDEIEELEDDPR